MNIVRAARLVNSCHKSVELGLPRRHAGQMELVAPANGAL
jgi:hypothetical protein